jgi:4-diphosphocytidyl-2-C-methyl-D-erythritol kinase
MIVLHESAPAKVNLVLAVSPKVKHGKHQLHTVFLTISLADALEFYCDEEQAPGVSIQMWRESEADDEETTLNVPLEKNIIYQSVRVFEEMTGQQPKGHLRVVVKKRIPFEGGLGGGSSDAAATLRALCKLFNIALISPKIHAAATRLGADVPFLIHGGCAVMSGAGELLERHLPVPALDFVLAKPAAGISTQAAYQAFDADPQAEPPLAPLVEALMASQLHRGAIAQACANNLYPAAVTLLPELADLRATLQKQPGVLNALLTGSGSVVFGICENKQAAADAAACLRQQGYWTQTCTSITGY